MYFIPNSVTRYCIIVSLLEIDSMLPCNASLNSILCQCFQCLNLDVGRGPIERRPDNSGNRHSCHSLQKE